MDLRARKDFEKCAPGLVPKLAQQQLGLLLGYIVKTHDHTHRYCTLYKLVLVSDTSERSSRYGHTTLRCPKYNRKTEGG